MAQPLSGMTPDSPVDSTKQPMAGAWVRKYSTEDKKEGKVFTTTYGGSGDLLNDGFRRMLVNACFWAVGLEGAITAELDTNIVGPYRPTWMGKTKRNPHVKPEDLAGWDTPVLPE